MLTGEPLALETIKKAFGGEEATLRVLGVDNLPEKSEKGVKAARSAARVMIGNLDTPDNADKVEMNNLEKFRDDLRRASNDSEISGVLPMRELLGLDKALQRIEGELANNMGKLSELDKNITHEVRKLEEIEHDPAINDKEALSKEAEARLKDLKEEHLNTA